MQRKRIIKKSKTNALISTLGVYCWNLAHSDYKDVCQKDCYPYAFKKRCSGPFYVADDD